MLNLSIQEFRLKNLFEEIKSIFEIQAQGKGINLKYKIVNEKDEEISDIEFKSD